MLYLTYTMVSSVDLAHYGVSRAKDWVSVNCGTRTFDIGDIDFYMSESFEIVLDNTLFCLE